MKVWYRRKKSEPRGNFEKIEFLKCVAFDFVYLLHPEKVISCEWRVQPIDRNRSRNVLLTTCSDGELRLWVESDYDQKIQFTVCIHSRG